MDQLVGVEGEGIGKDEEARRLDGRKPERHGLLEVEGRDGDAGQRGGGEREARLLLELPPPSDDASGRAPEEPLGTQGAVNERRQEPVGRFVVGRDEGYEEIGWLAVQPRTHRRGRFVDGRLQPRGARGRGTPPHAPVPTTDTRVVRPGFPRGCVPRTIAAWTTAPGARLRPGRPPPRPSVQPPSGSKRAPCCQAIWPGSTRHRWRWRRGSSGA